MQPLPKPVDPSFPVVPIVDLTDYLFGGPGGSLNQATEALHERTEFLQAGQAALAADIGAVNTALDQLQDVGIGQIARAVPLGWAYGAGAIALELWTPGYSLRDRLDLIALTGTVAGDDSIDVTDTNGLAPGQTYVICGPDFSSPESVTIAQILTASRLRATAPLATTRGLGWFGRSSFRIANGIAYAGPGARYFSTRISTLRDAPGGRVVIRRDTTTGTVALSWRSAGGGAWTPAMWVAAVERAAATRDEEWTVPAGGDIEIQLEATTPAGSEVAIHHIALVPTPPAAASLVVAPTVTSPTSGAVNVTGTPTVALSPYRSLYGVAQAAVQFQLALEPGFASPVWTGSGAAVSQLAVPAGALAAATVYRGRGRYRDADGVWSPWSTPISFSTGSTLAYIQQPQLSSPAGGTTAAALRPTLVSIAFAVVGDVDTHASSRWRVLNAGDIVVADSGNITGSGLLSWTVTADLQPQTVYRAQCLHNGAALGASVWSPPVSFTTQSIPSTPTLTTPSAGATGVSVTPVLSSSGFLVLGQTDSHAASQWQVALATDAGFAAPVINVTTAAVTTYIAGAGLPPLTAVLARVRHQGSATGWSGWSPAVGFQTGVPSGQAVYDVPGTNFWTAPVGVTSVTVEPVGGGGAGFVSSGSTQGDIDRDGGNYWTGGGGGGYARKHIPVVPGQQYMLVVGKGGRVDPNWGPGENGQTSSFAGLVSATGGRAGVDVRISGNQAAGGVGIGGDHNANGAHGFPGGSGGTAGDGGGRGGWNGVGAVNANSRARAGLALPGENVASGGYGGVGVYGAGAKYGGGGNYTFNYPPPDRGHGADGVLVISWGLAS